MGAMPVIVTVPCSYIHVDMSEIFVVLQVSDLHSRKREVMFLVYAVVFDMVFFFAISLISAVDLAAVFSRVSMLHSCLF